MSAGRGEKGKGREAHRRRLGGQRAPHGAPAQGLSRQGKGRPRPRTAPGAALGLSPSPEPGARRPLPPARGAHLVGELEHGHPPPRLPRTCSSRHGRPARPATGAAAAAAAAPLPAGRGPLARAGPGSRGRRTAVPYRRLPPAAAFVRAAAAAGAERSRARARGSRRPRPPGSAGGGTAGPGGSAPRPGRDPAPAAPGHPHRDTRTGTRRCPSAGHLSPAGAAPRAPRSALGGEARERVSQARVEGEAEPLASPFPPSVRANPVVKSHHTDTTVRQESLGGV